MPLSLLKWTVPSLIVGGMISTFLIHPQPMLVKGLFGLIAFIAGLLTLITLDRKGVRMELPANALVPVMLISLVGDLITGLVAIGKDEIIAAFCMLAYGLNANRAIGLGAVLLSITSFCWLLFIASISKAFTGSWQYSPCWACYGEGDWDHFLHNGFQCAQQKRLSLLSRCSMAWLLPYRRVM